MIRSTISLVPPPTLVRTALLSALLLTLTSVALQGNADTVLQSFSIEIKNDGGTLKHRISVGAFTANPATYDTAVSGASNAYNTTPCLCDSNGFTAGVGIEAANPSNIVLNTADQSGIPAIRFMTTVLYNSTGNTVEASPDIRNIDVDETTQNWASIHLLDESGWDFYANTTNIPSGKSIVIGIFGYMDE